MPPRPSENDEEHRGHKKKSGFLDSRKLWGLQFYCDAEIKSTVTCLLSRNGGAPCRDR